MTSCRQPSLDRPLGRSRDGRLHIVLGEALEILFRFNPTLDTFRPNVPPPSPLRPSPSPQSPSVLRFPVYVFFPFSGAVEDLRNAAPIHNVPG
jgi:hypothetical protein